jgi:ADP-heptose:LPS heptosyltransferase
MTLLLHHGALGDFVLTFPLLASLDGDVTVVSHASKAKLAERLFPHVSAADIETFRIGNARYDQLISFVGDVGRPCFEVHPRPPADWTQHVTAWHRHALIMHGVVLPDAPLPPVHRQSGDGPIVVHPGSGGRDKCWPPERFAALVDRLRSIHSVRVIAGEAEADRGVAGEAQVLLTLDALHDALVDASLYIGNDSGPTHLAAWLGVPTLALFGPSDPRLWAPIGRAVTVLSPPQPQPMSWLTVDHVLHAAVAIRRSQSKTRQGQGEGPS